MKKDIQIQKVSQIFIAICPAEGDLWDVFILNGQNYELKNVLIATKGYGEREGQMVNTSTLRHFYELVPAQSAVKIEPIATELFDLAHEYWISFQHDGFMFDKKYVFVAGSINKDYFRPLPILEVDGVMIG
jgi:hypothetical protein